MLEFVLLISDRVTKIRVSNAAERFSILTAGNGGEENQGHRTRIMQKMPNRKAWSACIGIGMEGDG